MFARSTSFSGSPDAIDPGIAFVRDEAMPTITQLRGCVGMSFVVDRGSGRCIATSSWETLDDMRASDDQAAPLRARGAEILGGTPMVEEWEVALMHREHITHDGSCCRVVWGRTSDLDRVLEGFRTEVLPQIEEMDGFCSASMLVDRDGGRTCSTVTFDSRAALDASRDTAAEMRSRNAELFGIEFTDVAEFDLAMAHLRLPELV
jgi:heme-degrading monooxygenase HmoA